MARAVSAQPFSLLQKLLIVSGVILVLGAGWYFSQGRADTTVGLTLTTNSALEQGLVAHWTFDGPETERDVCDGGTVQDADGNVYDTIQIGTQCWMQQNLRVGTRVDGSTNQTDNGTIERWCYSDSDANCDTNVQSTTPAHTYPDGGLYQWDEAMQYSTTAGAQGICPSGWHVPTDDEFKTLEMYLGMSQAQADTSGLRGTDQGTQLKPGGTSGFEGNLAGNGGAGFFFNRGTLGNFWSSSESGVFAWYRRLNTGLAQVSRITVIKTNGFSVRCLRDVTVSSWVFNKVDAGADGGLNGTRPAMGAIGQGIELDGTNDYVDVGAAGSGIQTLAFWAKTASSTQYLIDLNGSAYVWLNSGTLTATGFTSPTIYIDGAQTTSFPTDDNWHHVVITTGTGINASDMDIGRVEGQGVAESAFDDVRLYSRTLSANDVTRLYSLGNTTRIAKTITTNPDLEESLAAHWTFDGPNVDIGQPSAEIRDRSSNARHGNWLNHATTTTRGAIGQGIELDGTNDYVDIGNAGSGIQTLSFRIKTASSTQPLIDLNGSVYVMLQSGVLTFPGLSGPTVFVDNERTNILPTDNEWHVVTATFATGVNASDMDIGRVEGVGVADASFDDARLYTKELSPTEVWRLFGLGGSGSNAGNGLAFSCGTSNVFDADGNVYDTIQIGTQCWMQQNLRVGTRVDVSTNQTDNSTIERWCYSDSDANCDTNVQSTTPAHTYPDGGLYQWNEAMQYSTTAGAQGICPSGWHIPTDDEFKTLEMYLGMSQAQADGIGLRGTDQGTQLRPGGTSGFEGNLAGYGSPGSFSARGSLGTFWSSSESGASAWYRFLYSVLAKVYRSSIVKTNGYSVRCLKDPS